MAPLCGSPFPGRVQSLAAVYAGPGAGIQGAGIRTSFGRAGPARDVTYTFLFLAIFVPVRRRPGARRVHDGEGRVETAFASSGNCIAHPAGCRVRPVRCPAEGGKGRLRSVPRPAHRVLCGLCCRQAGGAERVAA